MKFQLAVKDEVVISLAGRATTASGTDSSLDRVPFVTISIVGVAEPPSTIRI